MNRSPFLICFLGVVLLAVFVSTVSHHTTSAEPTSPQAVPAPSHSFAAMTPAEHFTWATRLAMSNASLGELAEADKHLAAIPTDAPESAMAKQLSTKIQGLRRVAAANQRAQLKATLLRLQASQETARQEYAKVIDQQLLESGIESATTAGGPHHTQLVIRDALAGRVRAKGLSDNGMLFAQLRELGFKKLVYTDGYDTTFVWDLTK